MEKNIAFFLRGVNDRHKIFLNQKRVFFRNYYKYNVSHSHCISRCDALRFFSFYTCRWEILSSNPPNRPSQLLAINKTYFVEITFFTEVTKVIVSKRYS